MIFLEKVCNRFNERKIPYALVGGFAVALHGAPRGTIDLDFIVDHDLEVFINVEEALKSLGMCCRIPVTAEEVFTFRKEYIEKRNLIAWSFYNPKNLSEVVDIIITENLRDSTFIEKRLSNARIIVLSKSDLIKMKKKSNRLQDQSDIEALKRL
jgi:hypothetical protein